MEQSPSRETDGFIMLWADNFDTVDAMKIYYDNEEYLVEIKHIAHET